MTVIALALLSVVFPVSPGESIQNALDSAAPGDTILLLPGNHSGSGEHLVTITGQHDGIILLGDVSDPSTVTVDGSGLDGSIVYVDGLNLGEVGASTVIAGITFLGSARLDATMGGGVYSMYASPTFLCCWFTGNSADSGGGAYVWRGAPSFVSCRFSDNQCITAGAGLYLYVSDCSVISCRFEDNSSTDDGGAIFCYHSSPTITNCLFTGNYSVDNGGAIYCYAYSHPDIGFSTFSSNEATTEASAVYFRVGSSPTLHDNIVTENIGPAFWIDGGGTPVFSYNCVWNNPGGNYGNLPDPTGTAGNISQDPIFAADYHLSNQSAGQPVTSPCVDSGSCDADVFGLDIYWTRTDSIPDSGTADMGFHHGPLPEQTSSGGQIVPPVETLTVLPNPSTGIVSIGPLDPGLEYSIGLYNLCGRLVESSTVSGVSSVVLDINGYADGVYLVRVESATGARSGDVVKLFK